METTSSDLHRHIDYDLSYRLDILGLADDEREEQLEEKLMGQAKELGVDFDTSPQFKPLPNGTYTSKLNRRSVSIYSAASQSIDLHSNFSVASKDQRYPNGQRQSRNSLSLRDYDVFLARGITDSRRTSLNFSQPSTPSNSVFSLPLYSPDASPKKYTRVMRGLSILKLHRSDPAAYTTDCCPHCPKDPIIQRRTVHRLPCGHRLCSQALRNTIQTAMAHKAAGAVPCCCSIPIPGNLVEHVMTQDEQNALLDKLEQWDEAVSITQSISSEIRSPGQSTRASMAARRKSSESKVDSVAPRRDSELEKVQERPDYITLQHSQTKSRDNFLTWIERRRLELQAHHKQLRAAMEAHSQRAEDELYETHASAMADAEDKQVKAEADMRGLHAQEKRDNATALKHMEAYCAGTYNSTGELHNRTITDQDRAELDKTRRTRDTMDTKHDSAINVLRGEQGRRMRLRQLRQDKEVQELRRVQRMKGLELERECTEEVRKFEDFVAEKQRKIRVRWDLECAILARRVEIENGVVLRQRLERVEWPDDGGLQSEGGALRTLEGNAVENDADVDANGVDVTNGVR